MKRQSSQEVNGWLVSPDSEWCYRFHRDPDSWVRNPVVFVDKWSAQPDGSPSQMENRRKLPLDDALELCGQLILDGWQKLTSHFGEAEAA